MIPASLSIRRSCSVGLLCLAGLACSGAALQVTTVPVITALPPAANTPIDLSVPPRLGAPPVLRLPPMTTRQLANGLKIVIVERHELPLADLVIQIRTGSEADPTGKAGTAALTYTVYHTNTGMGLFFRWLN